MAESDTQTEQQTVQPGQVISPGTSQPAAVQTPATAQTQVSQPSPPQPQSTPQSSESPAPASSEPAPSPPFSEGVLPQQAAGDTITWTASEFVAHEKSSEWYLGLIGITLVIAGFVYLVTRDYISTIVVLVGAAAFGILGSRKPRQQEYGVDGSGINIGRKRYDYDLFRSFSIVPEGAFSSIVFMPLKRFAQTTTIYYAPDDEDRIIDLLSQHLPFEEHHRDPVDNLMRRIRF